MNYQRINIQDPVAIEKLLNYRRREYKQAVLSKARPVIMERIIRKGKWAAKRLAVLNATVIQGISEYPTVL